MSNHEHIILRLRDESLRNRDGALERAAKEKRDAETYQAQVDAYNRALSEFGGPVTDEARKPAVPSEKPVSRKRGAASDKWTAIYRTLHQNARAPYSYEDINAAVSLAGYEASNGGQRTQMMNAVKAGLFDRVETGLFEFTESGLALIGVSPSENSGATVPGEANAEDTRNIFGVHNSKPSLLGE